MTENNMQAVIDAARAGMQHSLIQIVGTKAHFAIPTKDGMAVKTINLEDGEPVPARKRGLIQVLDAASFNAILASNADAGNTTIYVDRDPNAPKIAAILNGQGNTGTGWGDFCAEILFRFTPQWLRWKAIDGKLLPQAAFAEFIEDNLSDIAAPPGADMLEIAQYLTATRTVDFKSAVRIASGAIQFSNVESIDASVKAQAMPIPEAITLGIAPICGLPPFRVVARFRYRIQDGKLMLGIKLQRIEDVMNEVVGDMVAGINVSEGVTMVEGIAPRPIV